MEPTQKPNNPNFSSGPCSKRPGYDLSQFDTAVLGRSHRSAIGKEVLADAINLSKEILNLPEGYQLGIVPASDTGAFEMAMWSMLGARPVDVCHWESFGKGWLGDITKELKLDNVREFTAPYGELPALEETNSDNDIIFTYNGTTSGVKVANCDWIADDRQGLTFCDATSAAFAMDMPWEKLDVTTYSWQKVLGSEGGHGVIILSPRAVERLESFKPDRPLPKIFRLLSGDKLNAGIFKGATINTPSMLAVLDYLDALNWAKSIGGLKGLIERSEKNLAVIEKFVDANDWINFLPVSKEIRSNTSICLSLDLDGDKIKALIKLLSAKGVAYDIGAYRDAPAGLRIWGGGTVESSDLEALMPWLTWAYQEVK